MLRYGLLSMVLLACSACGPQRFAGQTPIQIGAGEAAAGAAGSRVEVKDNKIIIHEKIQFEQDNAVIRSESFSLIAEIASTIRENPHIKKVRIEGHASSEGSREHNLQLSRDRAAAVMRRLIEQNGVRPGMLESEGFGESKPLASNASEEGREQNRRVEFTIIEQEVTTEKYDVDPETGQKTLVEQQTSNQ